MNRRLLATNIFIIIKYLLHIKPYIRTQGKHERCFYFQLFMSEKIVPYHIYLQAFWLLHLLHHRPTTQLSSSNLLHMLLYSFFSSIFTQTNWRVHYHHHQEKRCTTHTFNNKQYRHQHNTRLGAWQLPTHFK